jgi:hypothetical protein
MYLGHDFVVGEVPIYQLHLIVMYWNFQMLPKLVEQLEYLL